MIETLSANEYVVVENCSIGVFYNECWYRPSNIKLVKYDNNIIVMRAYKDKDIDVNIVFDRKNIKFLKLINNIKK